MTFQYIQEHYYIFILIIVFIICILFKSNHPFLFHNTLPVVKKYEIWKMFQSPQVIVDQFNYTSKYYNCMVITNEIDSESYNFNKGVRFIQNHFLSNRQRKYYTYTPTAQYLQTLHMYNSFESYFLHSNQIVSQLYSRPLIFYIKNNNQFDKHIIQFNDFLCTLPDYRKKNITPQLIYSHMTNVCNRGVDYKQNKAYTTHNKVFIAKYEHVSLPLKPLISYKSYIYNISKWNHSLDIHNLHPVKITRINKNNFHLFSSYMDNVYRDDMFDMILCERMDKLCTMIENEVIYLFILHHKDYVFATYIFHDMCMTYKDKKMIEFQCSIKHCKCDMKLFYHVFLHILQEIKSLEYDIIVFENISHNVWIQKYVHKDVVFEYAIPITYHIVNFIHAQYNPIRTLCIL